ncbi:MAG: hypothetical protein ACO1N1_24825 [Dyadobacter fermentans]
MKAIFNLLVLSMFLLVGIIGCDKPQVHMPFIDSADSTSVFSGEVSVPIAKKWFYEQYLKEQENTATDESKRLIRNVYWEQARLDTMTNGQDLLIVPIEHHMPGELTNADTYLWVFRHHGNKLSAKVIEYLSSVKDNESGIDISNFSGAMTVRDWNGKLINGFTFKNNVPVGLLHSVRGVETERIKDARSGRANMTICDVVVFRASTCTNFFAKICVNGNCSPLMPNDTPTFCEYYEIIAPQCYWVPDFPGQPNPYSGGPSDLTIISPSQITMPGLSHPAINLRKHLDCFGTNTAASTYKMTVYVAEPMSGTGKTVKGSNVGHTFIGLEKTTNGVTTRQVLGFYPNSIGADWVSSHVADNGGDSYTVSASWDLDAGAFTDAINGMISGYGMMYDINQYNCTTAAASVADAVGLTFPKTESDFPFGIGKGMSPGQLGKDIRNHQSSSGDVDLDGGTAPTSKGPCN